MIKNTVVITKTQIERLITMEEVINSVELAFTEDALLNVQMPAKKYMFFDDITNKTTGDLRIMPCYMEGTRAAGVKCVNVHPENPSKHNLPTVMAVIELIDPDTGFPIAIMDGTSITNMRTGASAGVATKYLARKDSEVCGFVGAGVQSLLAFTALNEVMDISEVKISSKGHITAEELASTISKKFGIEASAVYNVKDAVTGADVVTTTTPSRLPIVKSEWVEEGTHINAIGADAPGKQELESELLLKSKIVIDEWEQATHSGEINVPLERGVIKKEDVYSKLGDIIINKKPGRDNEQEITVFDSTGLAVQDIATAWCVYQKSLSKGTGQKIDLMS
ncbi:MAG: alanine dehydrogenase [Methanomicrobiales archaeon]